MKTHAMYFSEEELQDLRSITNWASTYDNPDDPKEVERIRRLSKRFKAVLRALQR